MSWPCSSAYDEDERMEYKHPLYGPDQEERSLCRQCEFNGICDYAPLRDDLCEIYGIRDLYAE